MCDSLAHRLSQHGIESPWVDTFQRCHVLYTLWLLFLEGRHVGQAGHSFLPLRKVFGRTAVFASRPSAMLLGVIGFADSGDILTEV